MDFYSIWPFFLGVGLLLGLARLPFFAEQDVAAALPIDGRARILPLDGLRGFLALSVFFHHAAIYHAVVRDGIWQKSPSQFYTLAGETGVAMFFMVTGYLFWSRLINEHGRPAWLRLYIGRVFRIGPLYLTVIAVMLLYVLVATGATLNVTPQKLCIQLTRWLSLGALEGYDVNAYAGTTLLLAGVTWTLWYEWVFYLSMPVLALVARYRRAHLPFALAGLLGCLFLDWSGLVTSRDGARAVGYAALFFAGISCGSLELSGLAARLPDRLASGLTVCLLAVVLLLRPSANSATSIVMLGAAFYLIMSGCTLFGLLVCTPARRLGDMSYGIYLVHGLVLAAVFRLPFLQTTLGASPALHWSLVMLCGAMTVVIASLAHRMIERPGIGWGRWTADLLMSRLPQREANAVRSRPV